MIIQETRLKCKKLKFGCRLDSFFKDKFFWYILSWNLFCFCNYYIYFYNFLFVFFRILFEWKWQIKLSALMHIFRSDGTFASSMWQPVRYQDGWESFDIWDHAVYAADLGRQEGEGCEYWHESIKKTYERDRMHF